jgi:hypothetical protein
MIISIEHSSIKNKKSCQRNFSGAKMWNSHISCKLEDELL